MSDPRPLLLDRLAEDLIGPETPDEILEDRPLDRYLTGIIYPQRSELAPQDQDEGAAEAGSDGNEDSGAPEAIASSRVRKPSSMGLSFRLEPLQGTLTGLEFVVHVSGGRYQRCRHAELIPDPGAPDGSKGRKRRPAWHRVPVEGSYAVSIDGTGKSAGAQGEAGLSGFDIHCVAVPAAATE